MRIFLFILLAGFATTTFSLQAQGPLDGYLKGKRVLDIAPSISFNKASTFAGANQQTFSEPYKGQMLSLFAEYGLTEKFDVLATGAVVFTTGQSGLQDGGIYVKYRPFYEKIGRLGQLGVLFGTGAGFPLADYEPTATAALGQKAVSVPARLIVQWETPLGLFFNLTGGYNWRLDDLQEEDIAKIRQVRPTYQPTEPRDFSTLLFKVGFPARHYYLDAWVEYQYTKGGADFVVNVPDLPQAYGVTYTQIGGTAYYSANGRNGVYISSGYILDGRNTSLIQRITLGAVFKVQGNKKR
jgi:hypothetical protein